MSDKNKNIAREFHKGYGPGNPHPAGGFYAPHIKGREDPNRGKTKRQKQTYKKKPLPGGYNIKNVG